MTLFWSLPFSLLPQAMLKVPSLILGVKGVSNQQHEIGGGGGMYGFAGFLQKGPNIFTHDCRVSGAHPWAG